MHSKKSTATLFATAVAALITFGAVAPAHAQNTYDDVQMLLDQVQTDKRAVILSEMELDDSQLAAFTPIYDEYQVERRAIQERGVDLLNAYAANYDTMTDEAAGKLLKDWLKLRENELALVKKYAKKFDKVLPTTDVLRFVQLENKLNTILSLPGIRAIPLAK
jgi:hypothetical protein